MTYTWEKVEEIWDSDTWEYRENVQTVGSDRDLILQGVTDTATYRCRVSDGYGNNKEISFNLSVDTVVAEADGPSEFSVIPGESVGIYANKNWMTNYIDASQLTGYKIWLAQYSKEGLLGRRAERFAARMDAKLHGQRGRKSTAVTTPGMWKRELQSGSKQPGMRTTRMCPSAG